MLARNHNVGREVPVDVYYKGELLASQRVDMIVDGKVVVEIKSPAVLPPTAQRQTLNYLRASSLELRCCSILDRTPGSNGLSIPDDTRQTARAPGLTVRRVGTSVRR